MNDPNYSNKYPDGSAVEVYDVGFKRWYRGKVLNICRINDANEVDGWEIELRNGNRGNWDDEHIRMPNRR